MRRLGRQIVGAARTNPASVVVIIAIGFLFAAHTLFTPAQWPLDGLYYRAQMQQVMGHSQASTIQAIVDLHSTSNAHLTDPNWVWYSQAFYRRRWLVPLLGAVLSNVVGDHALVTVSILGYIGFAIALYFLLRTRFTQVVSLVVCISTMLVPALRSQSFAPYTDAPALALETLALLALVKTNRLKCRWSAVFVLSMFLIGFTREGDAALVLVPLGVAIVKRSRLYLGLALGGLVAFISFAVSHGAAPLNVSMRFAEVGQNVPTDTSWATTLRALPDAVFHALRYAEVYLRARLSTGAFVAIGLAGAYLISSDSVLTPVIRLAPIVYVVTIVASPVFTDLRYELTLLPVVAVGWALVIDKLVPLAGRLWVDLTRRMRQGSHAGVGPTD